MTRSHSVGMSVVLLSFNCQSLFMLESLHLCSLHNSSQLLQSVDCSGHWQPLHFMVANEPFKLWQYLSFGRCWTQYPEKDVREKRGGGPELSQRMLVIDAFHLFPSSSAPLPEVASASPISHISFLALSQRKIPSVYCNLSWLISVHKKWDYTCNFLEPGLATQTCHLLVSIPNNQTHWKKKN
jgi:hypothetical protein